MRKYIWIFFTIFCFFPAIVIASEIPEVSSEAVILYQLNEDKVIYEKNSEEQLAPASLTKVMTMYVALEKITDLDQTVTLTDEMFQGLVESNASVAGFYVGETVTYRDLLYGSLFPSGGDATQALAILLYGNQENFVARMNEKAEELGMKQTHFENATGLPDENHYSTASDMALLLKEALKNKTFYELFTTDEYTTSNGKHTWIPSFLKTANTYGITVDSILGGKTGFTNEAGYCLASIATYDDVNYLLVTLHAPTDGSRAGAVINSMRIYNYFGTNYGYQTVVQKDTPVYTVKTKKYADKDQVAVIPHEAISYYLPNDFQKDQLKISYQGIEEATYGTKKGSKAGTVTYAYQGETLGTVPVYFSQDISFDGVAFLTMNWYWMVGGCILLVVILKITRKKRRKKRRKKQRK